MSSQELTEQELTEQELEEVRISIEHIITRSKLQKMFHLAYYDEDNNRWICSNPIRDQDV